jgi:hypothetical protein
MGIEEEEEQATGIHYIFNKIIAENFPNLERQLDNSLSGTESLQDTKQA